jgi:uncharacterized protein YndB with AHSA1/START domain
MKTPQFVYVTVIGTTPEKLWAALTTPEFTNQYWFGMRLESDWQVGSSLVIRRNGEVTDEGTVLRSEPSRLLSYSFHPIKDEEVRNEPHSRVTFEIEPFGPEAGLQGDAVRLTVTHGDFPEDSKVYPRIREGWPAILSNLKTLLETGRPLELAWKHCA